MSKVLNIGIFGACRGRAFYEPIKDLEGVRLHAILDKDPAMVEETKTCDEGKNGLTDDVLFFTEWDEFINSGLDAVILCNFFHEHAKYAIKAFEKGIAVMSDTTAAPTMKQCVDLCEAAEKYNGKYMLGANVPYMHGIMELTRVYKEGTFGIVKYADAEYHHWDDPTQKMTGISPTPHHWRKYLPRTYYNMHTLGTLMAITGETPVKVNGRAAGNEDVPHRDGQIATDAVAYTFCQTDGGAIFSTTGCASLGPNGKWFRLNCSKGTLETARHNQNEVKLAYTPWRKPEDVEEATQIYGTTPKDEGSVEARAQHNGSDYRLMKAFVEYLNGGDEPFFNVYRSCALSAAGILAWYSVMDDGNTYTIPDFKNPEERAKWADDDRSPFPDEYNGEGATLPCSTEQMK